MSCFTLSNRVTNDDKVMTKRYRMQLEVAEMRMRGFSLEVTGRTRLGMSTSEGH